MIASLLCLLVAAGEQSAAQESLVHSDSMSITAEQTGAVAVPIPTEKAMDYYHSGNILWIVEILWGILIPFLFLFTGFSANIRNWAQKIGKKWFWIIGIYFVFFSLISFVIDLPLSYYQEFVRQHAYGLSNQTPGKWIGDLFTSLMVGIIIGFLFLWLPYLALKKSPKRWWLYVGIGTAPFLFLTLLISPIWIDPMKDKVLETKILDLAERAGIQGSKVFEVNKSVDTKTLNAYVTGFLGTKRIVIWDNTLAKMNERELLFVLGHEMGHYLLGHTWKTIFFYSFLILITLYNAHRVAAALIDKFKLRFGFEELSDIASFPLIILLISIFSLIVINPAGNWFSRSLEHQADRFGLEITRDNYNAATAFVKLQSENLSNPRPGTLYKIWRMSHPPLGDRIEYANEYKPWLKNEKLEFEEYFKK